METAEEMANGALENSEAQIAVSVTGIAGPDGGYTAKTCRASLYRFWHQRRRHTG